MSAAAQEARAGAFVILAAFSFALISILTVVATREGLPLTMLMLLRFFVAGLVLTPVVMREPVPPVDGGRVLRVVITGGIGQAVVGVLSLAALAWIPVATLVVLFYTFPAWVTLLSAWRGHEKLTRDRIAALVLSLAGVLCLTGLPGGEAIHPTGIMLALAAALAYAIYVPLMGRLQVGLPPTRATWLIAIGVTVVFLVAAPVRGEFTLRLSTSAWLAVTTIGVFSTAIGLMAFLRGLSVLGPVRTSIICTVEPLFAAVLASLMLDQAITLPMAAGGVLILAAVVLLSMRPRPAAPAPGPQSSQAT